MNVDDLVRDALHEEAADSMPAPSYLADRVLAVRRRSRTRRLASLAATTAVAVAVAVAVLSSAGAGTRRAPRAR